MIKNSIQIKSINFPILNGGKIPITIFFSKRKTAMLSFNAIKDQLIMRVPFHTSEKQIQDILTKKQKWLYEQSLYKDQIHEHKRQYQDHLPLLGRFYSIARSKDISHTHKVQKEQIIFRDSNQDMEKLISGWYKGMAHHILNKRLKKCFDYYCHIVGKSNITVILTIKKMKTRLGSMNSLTKHMVLNEKLVQLPSYLIDFVIFHELTHINHSHHQKGFYYELSKLVPCYKEYNQELKRFFWKN